MIAKAAARAARVLVSADRATIRAVRAVGAVGAVLRRVRARRDTRRAGAGTVASFSVFPIARPRGGARPEGVCGYRGCCPYRRREPAGGRAVPSRGSVAGTTGVPRGYAAGWGPGGHRTGAPLAVGRRSRMGITLCNVPRVPLASPFTLVMTLIT